MDNIANAAEAVQDVIPHRFLRIVFASTSGHTEYVVDALIKSLKGIAPGWEMEKTMAEKTQPQDLLRGDILLLAAATWNTGGTEGQLNPHMWRLLLDKAKRPSNRAHASGSGIIDISTRLERRIFWSTT